MRDVDHRVPSDLTPSTRRPPPGTAGTVAWGSCRSVCGPSAKKGDAVLFRVTHMVLPAGTMLRPYAIAQNHSDLLRPAPQEIAEGSEAVAAPPAGATWAQLVSEGESRAGMVLLEAAFERVRRRIAPDLPSRLAVVFTWSKLADAVRYRNISVPFE